MGTRSNVIHMANERCKQGIRGWLQQQVMEAFELHFPIILQHKDKEQNAHQHKRTPIESLPSIANLFGK